jgi:hypothetical protein
MRDTTIQFNFLNRTYSAEVVASFTEKPFYFFVLFNENEIISEFGEELSIATVDGRSIINRISTDNKVNILKEAIFKEIRNVPEYSNKLSH